MRDECKENSPLNAQRRSLSAEKEDIIKKKRDVCKNTLPLSKRSSDGSEDFDKHKDTVDELAPRRRRKKLHPLFGQVISIDLTDDSIEGLESSNLPSPSPSLNKSSCKYCGEIKVTECSAPLNGAHQEKNVLNFPEIQSSWKVDDELPCVKLINYRVYDKARHLCAFDGKLLKARNGLYFSGFVKPYDSEKADSSDLFPCEDLGPIVDWWFEGFDPNDESTLGLSSKMAHYYLEKPMAEYTPFLANVTEKIFLVKTVIDILENLSDDEVLSYEGLLNMLKDTIPPEGIPTLTEEILLKNGVFVCEQIQSYDAASDGDEKLMASLSCIVELSQKVNYDFSAKSDDSSDISICEDSEIDTPVIDVIDLVDINSTDDEGGRRSRRRCRKYDDLDWLYEDDEKESKRGRKSRKSLANLNDLDSDTDAEEERERKPRHKKQRHRAPMSHRNPTRKGMMPTKTIELSKATTTPLVLNIFESFFSGEILKNYTKDYAKNTAPGLTTNRVYNSSRSDNEYNPLTPCLRLTKLEDMGIDWEDYKIRFACEWLDEETNLVSELKPAGKVESREEPVYTNQEVQMEIGDGRVPKDEKKIELEDEQMEFENTKMKPEDTRVLDSKEERIRAEDAPMDENQKKPVHDDLLEKSEKVPQLMPKEKEEENDEFLSIDMPVVREFLCVELEPLTLDVLKFYLNKNKRPREDVSNLDSYDCERDTEPSPKRKKTSEKPESSCERDRENSLKRKKTSEKPESPCERDTEHSPERKKTSEKPESSCERDTEHSPERKKTSEKPESSCERDTEHSPERKKTSEKPESSCEHDTEHSPERKKTSEKPESSCERDTEHSPERKKTSEKPESSCERDTEHSPERKKTSEKPESTDGTGYTVFEFREMLKKKKTRRKSPLKNEWIGEPYKEIEEYRFYKKLRINDSIVSVGDFVSTYKSNSVGCVKYLFENIDEEMLFHVHWFTRSIDTILAEVGHSNEVFESDKCEDVSVEEFYQVVSVKFIPPGSDWSETGNKTYINQLNQNEDPSLFLYYQKRYCEKTARFTDTEPESSRSSIDCYNCERQRKLVQREIPRSEEKSIFDKEQKMFSLKMVRWRDEEYRIGSCVFLTPGTIMNLDAKKQQKEESDVEEYDDEIYPEKYRKPKRVRSVQDSDVLSDPFEIGYICAIWSKREEITKSADVKLQLKKFYRPHNASLSPDEIRQLDLNILYWSDEECRVNFSKVQGKCYVSYRQNFKCTVDEWTSKGPYRFYFSQSYDARSDKFELPPSFAKKIGNLENHDEKVHVDIPSEYPPISRPLRSLDVFAGCGGLTEGLHQAKVAECHWAIEKDTSAAKAFKSNYPHANVFTDDCNLLLNAVIHREEKFWNGKQLPQKGDVEMLCGGPPCQGFSGMNRFRLGQWSKFNNSLVVSFLSYCDYYRPRFFVMENVRNFVSYEKSVVLKLTLNCLVKMGYQVAFGVLQSGRFGIPQSRRRVIILAAAPGETLPLHPEGSHTFAARGFDAVVVDDVKYVTSARWNDAAPYRMITAYDAISDLPPIKSGESLVERPYCRKAVTHFQRLLRTYNGEMEEESVLRDHISKSLNALVVKRLSFIPKKFGCDWRDLPNITVRLSDGTVARKLKYTHHDEKQGKASNGALRGVCCCVRNEKCRNEFRQSHTIIPWCLPHTGNRHGHWRGLYGRLGWDEYFRTVVTNPEPMGKQGRVVHPEEDRVISVRECARSQGFPDRFKFYGCILNKHRQIGNAVAPPLAKAIGLEIRKCIHEKESKVHVVS